MPVFVVVVVVVVVCLFVCLSIKGYLHCTSRDTFEAECSLNNRQAKVVRNFACLRNRNIFGHFRQRSEVFGKWSEIFGSGWDVFGSPGHDETKISRLS